MVREERLKAELEPLPPRFHNQENKQGSRGTTHYGDLRVGWIQGAGKVQRSQERKLRGPPIR